MLLDASIASEVGDTDFVKPYNSDIHHVTTVAPQQNVLCLFLERQIGLSPGFSYVLGGFRNDIDRSE
jgi:hypothetical protein